MIMEERAFIRHVQEAVGGSPGGADLLKALGDDCAVLAAGGGHGQEVQLITTDTLVAGVHFDLSFHPLKLLGRKAAAVNISDIAAMGGTPRFAQLSVTLCPALGDQGLADFMTGFLACCQEHGVTLTGGDTVSGQEASFTVTMLGEMAAAAVCYRHGGQSGDEVWVSGQLGSAAAGLALLQQGRGGLERFAALYAAHLDPVPQVPLGQLLARSSWVTAMQDISDGLATDLAHLAAASGLAAQVEADLLPLAPELIEAAALCQADHLDWGLRGGEDFQLLFTTPPGQGALLAVQAREELGLKLRQVGRLKPGSGVFLRRPGAKSEEISYQGYEHGSG
ncbi:MAG: thiamine-phosphate kinase [Thermodesulfobacteriota bacterium]